MRFLSIVDVRVVHAEQPPVRRFYYFRLSRVMHLQDFVEVFLAVQGCYSSVKVKVNPANDTSSPVFDTTVGHETSEVQRHDELLVQEGRWPDDEYKSESLL